MKDLIGKMRSPFQVKLYVVLSKYFKIGYNYFKSSEVKTDYSPINLSRICYFLTLVVPSIRGVVGIVGEDTVLQFSQ